MNDLLVSMREWFGTVPTWIFLVVVLVISGGLAFYIRRLWRVKDHLKIKVATLEDDRDKTKAALTSVSMELAQVKRDLESWHRDLLTGLLSRRMWQEEFRRLFNVVFKRLFDVDGAQRAGDDPDLRKKDHAKELSLLFIDIDHFKVVNDTYGHANGDVVLRTLGELINMIVRPGDLAGRYGGEEFVVALSTDIFGAQAFLRRLRKILAMKEFIVEGDSFHVTISAGAVQLVLPDTSIEKLIARADELLYEAKEAGRDRYALQECSGVQIYEH